MSHIKGLIVNWETHSRNVVRKFCSFMEHQTLVDVAICCGNSAIQVHKLVLASVSCLFKEEFEKDPSIEQVVLSGCDFPVVKNIIEIIYFGKTIVKDDHVKYLFSMIKLLQIKELENLFNDMDSTEKIYLPKPQFLTHKLKFPHTQASASNGTASVVNLDSGKSSLVPMEISVDNDAPVDHQRMRIDLASPPFNNDADERKNLMRQAEQACIKEAEASRLALCNLQKQLAENPRANNFIIEHSCTETTVENYIAPNASSERVHHTTDANDKEDILLLPILIPQSGLTKEMTVPTVPTTPAPSNITTTTSTSTTPATVPSSSTSCSDKNIKITVGDKTYSDIEIMLKDIYNNSGSFSNEVLQQLSTKGVHYEVQGEDGSVSLMQELFIMDKLPNETNQSDANANKPIIEMSPFLNHPECELDLQENPCYVVNEQSKNPEYVESVATKSNQYQSSKEDDERILVNADFSPDIFFADINAAGFKRESLSPITE